MAFTLTGCIPSFRMNGTAINYDIYKTIDISEFPSTITVRSEGTH